VSRGAEAINDQPSTISPGRRRRRRLVGRLLCSLLLALLAAVVVLSTHGFPAGLTHRILRRASAGTMAVWVGRARLNVFEGIVASDFRAFRKGNLGPAFFEAEEAVWVLRPSALFRRRARSVKMRVRNALLRPNLMLAAQDVATHADLPVQIAIESGVFAWRRDSPSSVTVGDVELDALGHRIRGGGVFVFRSPDMAAAARATEQDRTDMRWLFRLLRHLGACRWHGHGEADVRFLADVAHPERLELDMALRGRNATWHGARIGAWDVNTRVRLAAGTATVALRDGSYGGTAVPDLSLRLEFTKGETRLEDVRCQLSRDRRDGLLEGRLTYETESHRYRGNANLRCYPRAFLPLLTGPRAPVAEFIELLGFPGPPPVCDVGFTGTWDMAEWDGSFLGHMQTTNWTFRSVPATGAHADFDMRLAPSNSTVTLDPLLVTRQEGIVQGRLTQRVADKTLRFDLNASVDPRACAKALGTKIEGMLTDFSFRGPVSFRAHGVAGYESDEPTDFRLTGKGLGVGLLDFVAEECAVQMHVKGKRACFPSITGLLYGGDFKATAEFFPDTATTNVRYEIGGEIADADFMLLASALKGEDVDAYEGALTGSARVTGLLGKGHGRTAEGNGEVRIRDGHLFDIPLFGGLTEAVSKFIPGFRRLVAQTDGGGSFTIADGKVHSEDMEIKGVVLSVEGTGDYYLDGRLDYVVRLKILRDFTFFGKVVKGIVYPVRKLLEFRLGGTLTEPNWALTMIPKRAKPGAEESGE